MSESKQMPASLQDGVIGINSKLFFKIQIRLLKELIKAKDEESNWRRCVFFWVNGGIYLWDDNWMLSEIVSPLIYSKILIFNGFENHQGMKLPKYIIDKNFNLDGFTGIPYVIGERTSYR